MIPAAERGVNAVATYRPWCAPVSESKIANVRHLLGMWKIWFSGRGLSALDMPSSVPYIDAIRGGFNHEDRQESNNERADLNNVIAADASIRSLPPVFEHAIYARYLRDVLESEIADEGERRLVPLLERRHVLL